jgi:hypothetical protein
MEAVCRAGPGFFVEICFQVPIGAGANKTFANYELLCAKNRHLCRHVSNAVDNQNPVCLR